MGRNKGGTEPSCVEAMTRAARASKPDAVVQRGDPHAASRTRIEGS